MSGFLKLSDHCEKIGAGSTPRGGHKSYVANGIPLIRSQNVLMRSFTREGLARITTEIHQDMAGTEVRPDDVLLNITGASIGRVCLVPDDLCPANVNQHVCIIRCGEKIDPRFLMLYLSSPAFQKLMDDTQAGGTRQALTKSDIEDFEIPALEPEDQKIIAERELKKLAVVNTAERAAASQFQEVDHLRGIIAKTAFRNLTQEFVPSTVPFDLAFETLPVGHRKLPTSEYKRSGKFKIVDQGKRSYAGYTDREDLAQDSVPLILFGDHTRIVKFIEEPFVVGADGVRLYRAAARFLPEFLFFFLLGSDLPKDTYGRHSKYLPALSVPLLSREDQQGICKTIHTQYLHTNRARDAAIAQMVEIERLPGQLLLRAFES